MTNKATAAVLFIAPSVNPERTSRLNAEAAKDAKKDIFSCSLGGLRGLCVLLRRQSVGHAARITAQPDLQSSVRSPHGDLNEAPVPIRRPPRLRLFSRRLHATGAGAAAGQRRRPLRS